MPYRADAHIEPVVAATFAGALKLELLPGQVRVSSASTTLTVLPREVMVTNHKKPNQVLTRPLIGQLVMARGVPRGELAVWMENRKGMIRVFDAVPRGLLEDDGLAALRSLDQLSVQLHAALQAHSKQSISAVEIGPGLDRVLLVQSHDCLQIFERPLFRKHSRLVLEAWTGGKLHIVRKRRTIEKTWSRGITVQTDYICFFDKDGKDLARMALPWILPEDRREIARRIGLMLEEPL
jgi:hypothetical protein